MVSKEIQSRIRALELKTKKVLAGALVGDHQTSIKGSGFEFDQIRPYEQGDDVRFIDWRSSAKVNKLLFKQYLEDKNRNITICLDVSSSGHYSSDLLDKQEIMNQIAGALALIAEFAQDRVSLILFSDKVELHVQKGAGPMHIKKIISSIFEFDGNKRLQTNLNAPLEHIIKHDFKEGVIFLVSDFIDQHDYLRNLSIISRKCEVIAIKCNDKFEAGLPKTAIFKVKDIETGEQMYLNTKNVSALDANQRLKTLKKKGIGTLEIATDEDFVVKMVKFFRKRMMY